MNIVYSLLFTIVGILIAAIVFLFYSRKKQILQYHIKVKFARGIQTKLVLNDSQYEQFKAWLERPDGIYDISDGQQSVTLDRQYVASVEVKKR